VLGIPTYGGPYSMKTQSTGVPDSLTSSEFSLAEFLIEVRTLTHRHEAVRMPGFKTPTDSLLQSSHRSSEATRGRARAYCDVILRWLRQNRNVDSTAELSALAGLNESRGTLFASRRVSLPDLGGASVKRMQPALSPSARGRPPFNTINTERR
jgi:hypothetical protein